MANLVTLALTDFDRCPEPEDYPEYSMATGSEYEARTCIPLFWLCLFTAHDVKLGDEEGRRFAYLFAELTAALAAGRRRLAALRTELGPQRVALYEEWLQRLEGQPRKNVLVLTSELDGMDDEGVLESELRSAFQLLDAPSGVVSPTADWGFANVIGIQQHRALGECESYELVGGDDEWPELFNPPPPPCPPPNPPAPKKRRWWQFWRSRSSL